MWHYDIMQFHLKKFMCRYQYDEQIKAQNKFVGLHFKFVFIIMNVYNNMLTYLLINNNRIQKKI